MPKLSAFLPAIALAVVAGLAHSVSHVSAAPGTIVLPNGWLLRPPPGAEASTGTMPQGMAPSPDGTQVAVVEGGFNPPALSLYRLPGLEHVATIPLPDAFGRPLWISATHVLVPGANSDALLDVDISTKRVRRIPFPKNSYPLLVAVAPDRKTYAVACDGEKAIRIGTLSAIGHTAPIAIGGYPGGLAFNNDGTRLFATVRSGSTMYTIDTVSLKVTHQTVGLHPSALAIRGNELYVALTDADAIAIYDARDVRLISTISLRDTEAPFGALGVSPNAIYVDADAVFVSLAAANSIAVIRNDRLVGRTQGGWYPTDVAAVGRRLYVLDGKGEGARPNPQMKQQGNAGYIAAIEFGSLRAYNLADALKAGGNAQGSFGWRATDAGSVVRRGGPIKHVFFVLKENRTYDEILGDVRAGNGDPSLAWFGAKVTPNEHAIAARFGLFDNAYTSGEVSAAGHLWSDAGFANDYLERFWPALYAQRLTIDDLSHGVTGSQGYIWQDARRAHVSFRDYGELVDPGKTPTSPWTTDVPSLRGVIDPHYAGWNLDYSDLGRAREWRREFESFVRSGTLPQFEFIWLPNDHTYGSKAGKLTPASYIATNDDALGKMVDTLTHSKVWATSVMFIIEDDAQDGPDHVSDQRTTLFVVSPYARGGLRHEHYATVSVLRTIEMVLGMPPLSTYDAMAVPMFSAFTSTPNLRPYNAIAPEVSLTKRNSPTAYGAAVSAGLNFARPDAVPDDILNDILAHNHNH
ncbi:MAG TPA: bifunctional YncE family protein/alkaline phosphatase family protein [Candidatus Baltobacteraceae bacterium]|nr:bifunctional YncE family protein/alkaline phosphatase family protein [Candidatus Baltobacteraceae bacterium]